MSDFVPPSKADLLGSIVSARTFGTWKEVEDFWATITRNLLHANFLGLFKEVGILE